jgi:hypothetical protein
MQRLLKLAKKIAHITPDEEAILISKIRRVSLLPWQYLDEEVPLGSWFFIEEGFLMALTCKENIWECTDFFYEGAGWNFGKFSSSESRPGFFRLEAVEQTILYIIPMEEISKSLTTFPKLMAITIELNSRTYVRLEKRSDLYHLEPGEKIEWLEKRSAPLLRAPTDILAGKLMIRDDADIKALADAQRRFQSSRSGAVKQDLEK